MYCGQQRTGPLFVRTYPIYEVVIDENEYGFVDTVMRDSEYSVRNMVHIWGDKCPKHVKELYDKGQYENKFKVVHAVTPRADNERDYSIKTREHMPVASCYIMEQDNHVLEESGVEEFPYVVPRWWVATGEIYGRSPAMTALPQIKVSNIATRDVMNASEKAVDPPLTVPHEGLVGPVRSGPRGLTYLRNKTEIGQLPTSSNLPYATEYIQALDNSIRTTMFVDQVQFIGDFKMTATEVMQRQTERMRLLGPVLGRLENEFLNPLITRVFGIMARNGLIEKAPEELQGAELRIEYQSPLARAQKSQIAQGFQQVIGVLEPLAKLSPQVAQQLFGPIDMNKVTPALFDWFGVDTDLLKHDDQQQQDDQQQRMMQMMQQMVPMLAKAFKEGGQGMDAVASAGKQAVETTGMAQQMPMPGPPGGAPAGPPPGQGGQDIQALIGSIMRGGAQALPAVTGPPGAANAAYNGRLQ
jgi:hypothetical protein